MCEKCGLAGTTSWSRSAPILSGTTYQLTALQPATSYDIIVEAQNVTGAGVASAVATVLTANAAHLNVPPQVTGLAASPTSSDTVTLSWITQIGASSATSFTVLSRLTGSPDWTSSVAGILRNGSTISGLQAATNYDFSVVGINSAGAGPASATVTAATQGASLSVTAITWNLAPSGTYSRASGSLGINAHVTPAAAPTWVRGLEAHEVSRSGINGLTVADTGAAMLTCA